MSNYVVIEGDRYDYKKVSKITEDSCSVCALKNFCDIDDCPCSVFNACTEIYPHSPQHAFVKHVKTSNNVKEIIKNKVIKQGDKEVLLKDLCARMPYGVICHYNCAIRCDTMDIKKANCVGKLEGIIPFNGHIGFMVGGDKVNALFNDIKPYLRSLSSMTEEEDKEWQYYKNAIAESCDERLEERISELHDWFNKNMFDYRGLIPKGLAIEVTKENNPYEKINL